MEMRNSSFSAMYQSKVESVVMPGTAISPHLFAVHSFDYNPALMLQSIIVKQLIPK